MSEREVPGLAAGRVWAATRFPYLATGLFGTQVVAEDGIGTVAVDEGWRLHADPELTARWTPAQLGSVLVHHVGHLLRAHAERAAPAMEASAASQAGTGRDAEAELWVRCADAEINDDLVPAGLELPGSPVLPAHLGAQPGGLAEQYFETARRRDGAYRPPGQMRADRWDLDCGSGADGRPRPWDSGAGPRLAPSQARLLARQVAQDCLRHGREAGDVPAGLLRWADELLEPAVDWRKALAAELRRAVADTAGAVDYSYRRPSRRASVAGAVVLPALRRPVPDIAVVCDTSGSMSEDLLAVALAEVEGLLRAVGAARQLRVLACDTAVAPARRVSSARQVELIGGGGTDMGAGIDAASRLRPRPAITVVLTDGYTPWPDEPPRGMRVVVGLIGDEAPEAPAWARAVRVPGE
ncbi:MAG TPA: VWA-like domain-containing protein [Streptosporangiaceae bacterium]|nr:VWA-like domain-containing protein [Streptosporangiaceae bacterium]